MLLSQERVAEISGLSLRTVQRLEARHRVSYASLRALAATFEIDVDLLERELYGVKDSIDTSFGRVRRMLLWKSLVHGELLLRSTPSCSAWDFCPSRYLFGWFFRSKSSASGGSSPLKSC